MKNITNQLSAAALIALMSDGVLFGGSWLRLAASAYRPCLKRVTREEIDRRYALDGEVWYLAAGERFEIIDQCPFNRFQDEMLAQIAKAFGGRVK